MEFATVERPACPLCGTAETSVLFDVWDDRYGQPDTFLLRRCEACDYVFLGSIVSPEATGALYGKYYPKPESVPLKRYAGSDGLLLRLARWLDGNLNPAHTIHAGERVLDVGCGPGATLEIGRRRGALVEGLEVDTAAAVKVKGRGFICHEGTIESCPTLTCGSYDRIILSQVLEHVAEPAEALRRCGKLLKPHGEIVVAAPHLHSLMRRLFGQRWASWHAPYHVGHFSRRALTEAAARAGLRIQSFSLRTPSNWLLMQLFFGRATRGVPNPRFRTSFPIWMRTFVAPMGRLIDLIGCGEGFESVLVAKHASPGVAGA